MQLTVKAYFLRLLKFIKKIIPTDNIANKYLFKLTHSKGPSAPIPTIRYRFCKQFFAAESIAIHITTYFTTVAEIGLSRVNEYSASLYVTIRVVA